MADLDNLTLKYLDELRDFYLEDTRAAIKELQEAASSKTAASVPSAPSNTPAPPTDSHVLQIHYHTVARANIVFLTGHVIVADCHSCAIPEVMEKLQEVVPALAYYLRELQVDAVASAVSWLNLSMRL